MGADCKGHFSAETTEDLVKQVTEHFKTAHKIKTPSQTIMKYVTKMSK